MGKLVTKIFAWLDTVGMLSELWMGNIERYWRYFMEKLQQDVRLMWSFTHLSLMNWQAWVLQLQPKCNFLQLCRVQAFYIYAPRRFNKGLRPDRKEAVILLKWASLLGLQAHITSHKSFTLAQSTNTLRRHQQLTTFYFSHHKSSVRSKLPATCKVSNSIFRH